ncbi:MAG: hypothetical protein AUJ55_01880 [Proteobacteria bacterium CG1_02_64_396]|nr:MAG: hypothetical protein AUJ55_01880 [Proteobacteria bacterium CG1_02_64_396]
MSFDLHAYLSQGSTWVQEGLGRLLPSTQHLPKRLVEAMHYGVMNGGKRLRPILIKAACEAVGGDGQRALPAACAMECVHSYSLVHDDLPAMDDDDLRRGRPTTHIAFDEATAILAGDALLTHAFVLLSDPHYFDVELSGRLVHQLATAAGASGMVGGQMLDMEGEGKNLTLPELTEIHIYKTGALLRACLVMGGWIGGGDEAAIQRLSDYGERIGLAFQIVDDILDETGTTEELGKPAGSDQNRGKATFPAILGLSESREHARRLIDEAVVLAESFGSRGEPLKAIAQYIFDRTK